MMDSVEQAMEHGGRASHSDLNNDVGAIDSAATPDADGNNSRHKRRREHGNSSDDNEDDDGNDIDDFEGSSHNEQQQQQKYMKTDSSKPIVTKSSSTSGKGKVLNDQERERRREELRRARAERKRCREKERRSNVNKEYVELTALLMKIDSSGFSASDETLEESGLPSSRLDLISRTVLVLERLHEENLQLKKQLLESTAATNKPTAVVDTNVHTEAASGASEPSSKKEVTMNHDMVGTLLIPVMVPHDYPVSQVNLSRDSALTMSGLSAEAILPFSRGSRLVEGIRDSSKYSVNVPNNFVYRDHYPYSQMSSILPNSYLPAERVPSVEVEAMLSLNRSMPSPAAVQPMASTSSMQDEARLSSHRSHTTRSVRVERTDDGVSNAQQPRFSTI